MAGTLAPVRECLFAKSGKERRARPLGSVHNQTTLLTESSDEAALNQRAAPVILCSANTNQSTFLLFIKNKQSTSRARPAVSHNSLLGIK